MIASNILFCVLLLLENHESLADSFKNSSSVGELQNSVDQCYGFCNQIKPILDHVGIYQPQWMLSNVFETQLKNLESRLAVIKPKKHKPKLNLKKFIKIRSRYYHIGNVNKVNWFAAFKACRKIGAELAILQNNTELSDINQRIQPRSQFWLGNNYLTNKGRHRIFPFNKPVFFGDWWWNGTLDEDGQGCLVLYESRMWDTECDKKHNYICEAVIED